MQNSYPQHANNPNPHYSQIVLRGIVIIYGCLMVVEGSKIMILFRFEKSPAAGINLMWENAAIPVAGIFIMLYGILGMVQIIVKGEGKV